MCVKKLRLKDDSGHWYEVPCGHCPECIQQRRAEWTGRNMVELAHSKVAYHVTFTFEELLLIPREDYDYYKYFDFWIPKKCVYQKLLKRMRKQYDFRYFGAFEFGSNTHRPHYHIIFYFKDDVSLTEDDFKAFWPYGLISVTHVEQATTHYLTKDLMKRMPGAKINPFNKKFMSEEHRRNYMFKVLLSKRSFNFMSLRPAIGSQLLENKEYVDFVRKYYDDFDTFPMLGVEGQKFPFPRYYVKKLFPDVDLMEAMELRNADAAHRLSILKGGELNAFLYQVDHAENSWREYEAYLTVQDMRKQI